MYTYWRTRIDLLLQCFYICSVFGVGSEPLRHMIETHVAPMFTFLSIFRIALVLVGGLPSAYVNIF